MATALFLDIRDSEIETYLFDSGRGGYTLKESKVYPRSGSHDFPIDPVPGAVENTYVSLPLSNLDFRVMDLPFGEREKVRDVLPFELDNIILEGSENVVFDCIPLTDSGNTSQVLAVYVSKKIIRGLLEKLKTYNADPVCITSLDLRKVIRDFSPERLLAPGELDGEERISVALEEMKSPVLNLRRDEFAYTRETEKTRRSLRLTALLAMVVVMFFAADILLNIVSVRSEIAAVKNAIRKEYQEVFPGEKNIVNELHQMKSHMKELKNDEEIFLGISPLAAILAISEIDRQDVVFHEMTMDRENLILKGEAPTLGEVQKMKDRLEPVFDGVALSDSKSSAAGGMLFTITARERKS